MAIKKQIEIEVKTNADEQKGVIDTLIEGINGVGETIKGVGEEVKTGFNKMTQPIKSATDGVKNLGNGVNNFVKGALAVKGISMAFDFFKEVLSKNQKVMDYLSIATDVVFSVFSKLTTAIVTSTEKVFKATNGFDSLTKVLKGGLGVAIGIIKLGIEGLASYFNLISLEIKSVQLAWEKSFFGSKDPTRIKELETDISSLTQKMKDNGKNAIEAGKQVGNGVKAIVTNVGGVVGEIGKAVTTVGGAVVDTVKGINIKSELEAAKGFNTLKKQSEATIRNAKQNISTLNSEAEALRGIRDDTLNSVEERIDANNKLGEVNKKIEVQTKALTNAQVDLAKAEYNKNKTTETANALSDAQVAKGEAIQAITGQINEQTTNAASLTKELMDLNQSKGINDLANAKATRDANADLIESDNERYLVKKENLKKDLNDENARLDYIIKTSKKGTQVYQDAQNAKLTAKTNFDNADAALDKANEERLKKLNITDLALVVDNENAKQSIRLAALDDYTAKQLLNANLTEEQKTKILKDGEAKRAAIINSGLEIDRNLSNSRLSLKRAEGNYSIAETREKYNKERKVGKESLEQEKEDAKKRGEDLTNINKKIETFNNETKEKNIGFANEEKDAKLEAFAAIGNAMGALTDIVGKDTAEGKALAIAQATINTFLAITEIWRAKSSGVAAFDIATKVAGTITAAASGFAAVKGIVATKVPGGGGGGGGAVPASLSPTVATASQTSPQTQLALSVANAQREPVKAYVVSNEMTTQQALDRNTKSVATFG